MLFQTNREDDEKVITAQTIIENEKLVKKVEDELQLCEDKDKDVSQTIKECLTELEEKGFLNITGSTTQQYML